MITHHLTAHEADAERDHGFPSPLFCGNSLAVDALLFALVHIA